MPDQQLSIFDLDAGRRRRNTGVARAAQAADPAFMQAANWAIRAAASQQAEFTTDHVWELMHDMALPMPDEPRALGALMKAAATAGICAPTDRIITSARPECHARPVRVWRSLIGGQP